MAQQRRRRAVHRDRAEKLLPGFGQERPARLGGRVVDEHADFEISGVRHDAVDRRPISEVGLDTSGPAAVRLAQPGRQLAHDVAPPCDQHHIESGGHGGLGHRRPESHRCTGDEGPSAVPSSQIARPGVLLHLVSVAPATSTMQAINLLHLSPHKSLGTTGPHD